MSVKRLNEIRRQIIISFFWGFVALGLIVSNSVHGFWMFLCWFWFISHVISLYRNIGQYGRESRKSEQRFRESQENFKRAQQERYNRIFNDFAKKIYEQQHQQRQTLTIKPEMSITDAYRLMKLKYTDTPEDVKKRYRQLAMQWHPDKFATESKSKQEAASRNFQKLNNAYNVIKKHKKIA